MKTVEEYLARAKECDELAAKVDPSEKEQVLKIAETWRTLAHQREQLIRSKT